MGLAAALSNRYVPRKGQALRVLVLQPCPHPGRSSSDFGAKVMAPGISEKWGEIKLRLLNKYKDIITSRICRPHRQLARL